MARKHNSKKDTQAKARAKAADAPAAKEWIEQRHDEEQAKMDDGAVKDVTRDPEFTPDVGASSKSVPTDPDWKDKMQARGKGDTPPKADAAIEDDRVPRARSKDVKANRAAITPSRAAAMPATKASKGTRASTRKTARKGNKAGTVKTGV